LSALKNLLKKNLSLNDISWGAPCDAATNELIEKIESNVEWTEQNEALMNKEISL